MPPKWLFDIGEIDLNKVVFDTAAIESINPQSFEMRQIDAIVHFDPARQEIIALKEVKPDEFWVRGHIPGRPLYPGVLMVEAAAQMSSIAAIKAGGETRFIGFGGIENVKFRKQVVPGDKLYILGKFIKMTPRKFVMAVQGIVDGVMAFEGEIIGMPL
ncbi:MAG: beta-hydroxyacyl-ACP dehydratase [Sedimentisphaerales bacterium]|nr:beta-hydroxyacyl-ACP dehydratase [Sedimentisphaerales bacterium]MBN2841547.1 beta-hydroxyacyl-ACP dehydratase [Sedimentisphaerales bacterium]